MIYQKNKTKSAMTIEHKITERFYYTAFSIRFFYEIIAKHMLKPTKKGIWHK